MTALVRGIQIVSKSFLAKLEFSYWARIAVGWGNYTADNAR